MTDAANTNAAHVHAVITVSDHQAQITRFNADDFDSRFMKAKHHETRQHNADVRDVHEFFADVCDAVTGLENILITGNHTGLADFKHYVTKHRPALAAHIIGYETVDHPTEGQLVAHARTVLRDHERLAH